VTEAPRGGSASRSAAAAVAFAALVGWAAVLYWGVGPTPQQLTPPWWQPRGFLLGTALLTPFDDNWRLAIAALWLPALLLAAGVAWLSRSALVRTLAVAAALACFLFLFYGLRSPGPQIWTFFRWRGSSVMLGVAAATAIALCAPLLARSWVRLGPLARLLSFAPLLVGVALLGTHVTGTDPTLAFAISPWPVVTVFGFDFVMLAVACVLACAGFALAAWRLRSRNALAAAAALLMLVAAMVLVARLRPSPLTVLGAAIATALAALALAGTGRGGLARGMRSAAGYAAIGGLGLALPVFSAQAWSALDYRETRDGRAQRIIDGLAAFYAREGSYPEDLRELVTARDLAEIPRPRIGLPSLGQQEFIYQNFGTDYLLEFSAPGWTQCAYSPPWQDAPEAGLDDEEEPAAAGDAAPAPEGAPGDAAPAEIAEDALDAEPEDAEAGDDEIESLPGSWSCPTKPPELW
jgi:hypothetical protein